jgi:hypothetical protein
MKALWKGAGILVVALSLAGCADRITDAPQAKLKSAVLSSDALPGAQVAVYFEPGEAGVAHQWYYVGPIHLQDDWTSSGAAAPVCVGALLDHQVVSNALPNTYPTFGSQSLRISNAVTTGCFGDQTFSKRLTDAAGESDADPSIYALSDATPKNHFEAQWDFASTMPGTEQPGLSVVASPDRGDGSRMSWVQMADTPEGLDINFYDVQGTTDPANFVGPTSVASGLDRTVPHTIRITMDFVEGPSNDVVRVYVDGRLRLTGTSWENYYRYDSEAYPEHQGRVPIVNRILFRTGGTAAPATVTHGFVFDAFSMKSGNAPTNAGQCKNGGWQTFDSQAFRNQGACIQFVNTGR